MTFKDTNQINAMFYLDDSGQEMERQYFLKELVEDDGQKGFMLYVGGGYVPLSVAVIHWNESDAVGTFEEWCRNNDRLDEIGEDKDDDDEDWGTYELFIETIPEPVIIPDPANLEPWDAFTPVIQMICESYQKKNGVPPTRQQISRWATTASPVGLPRE